MMIKEWTFKDKFKLELVYKVFTLELVSIPEIFLMDLSCRLLLSKVISEFTIYWYL